MATEGNADHADRSRAQPRLGFADGLLVRVASMCIWVLLLLPLVYASILTWQEYLRLGAITAGLAYFWWRRRSLLSADETEGTGQQILLAVVLIFIAMQFDPSLTERGDQVSHQSFTSLILGGVIAIAFSAFALSGNLWKDGLGLLDWIVLSVVLLAFGLSLISYLLFGKILLWISIVRLVFYLMLWFLVTRWSPARPESRNRLWMGLIGVFVIACLVGCVRTGMMLYHHRAGDEAYAGRNYARAVEHYGRVAQLSQALGFEGMRDASVFGQAQIFYEQGEPEKAASILSMEEGFVKKVGPHEWEGPVGGMLYKNTSCWKDLKLYEGEVEIRVFARGYPALKIWPQMRVRLGEKILGEVEVNFQDLRPYVFQTSVKTGTQRLEISFLNDYWKPGSGDRSLQVEQAEIHYQKVP